MHGGGYETRQAPLFQNTPFVENITNQILRLNYTKLICKPVRIQNKSLCRVTVSSQSIEKQSFYLIFVILNIYLLLLPGDNITSPWINYGVNNFVLQI